MLISFLKKYKMETAASLAVILILAAVLMIRPITGVADNGDFARIMNSTGLSYLTDSREDRYYGFVNRIYGIGPTIPFGGGYLSTQIPLVWIAATASEALTGNSAFDIRFLGAIYVLLLTFAAFMTTGFLRRRAGPAALIPAVILILVFCDTGYTAYFNSLYGEPVTFVFLLLMTGAALAIGAGGRKNGDRHVEGRESSTFERPAFWLFVVFCVASLFFTGAKLQNVPGGILASLLCIRLGWLGRLPLWRKTAVVAAVSIVMVSIVCYFNVSYEIKVCNRYQSVFYGVLRGSGDPAGDLKELGLDPSLAVLAGTNYFMESYPVDIHTREFKRMIFDNVSYGKIGSYYLRHPARLLQKLVFAAENGFQLKTGFGNYEKYPGIEYKQNSAVLTFWSDFKLRVLPHTIPFLLLFFTVILLVLAYEYRKANIPERRFLVEFFGFIAMIGAMQFVLPIIADGEADASKHLFLFNLSFDILFGAGLTYLILKSAAAVRYIWNRRLVGKFQTE